MNKTPALIFLILVSLVGSEGAEVKKNAAAVKQKTVTWLSYNDGIKLARSQKKHVIIDFYAVWCRYCNEMDEKIFKSPEVAEFLLKNYICVRIDADNPSQKITFRNYNLSVREFTAMAGVTGLPTVVFMDKDQNLITRIPGYMSKDVFFPVLRYINDECYKSKVNLNDYIAGSATCGKSRIR
ncbi:MAG: thioredoxin family protein [Spirochaetes bacterium]|nr:thioredoxin family protein [Spirochaetota bacterium]